VCFEFSLSPDVATTAVVLQYSTVPRRDAKQCAAFTERWGVERYNANVIHFQAASESVAEVDTVYNVSSAFTRKADEKAEQLS